MIGKENRIDGNKLINLSMASNKDIELLQGTSYLSVQVVMIELSTVYYSKFRIRYVLF